MRQILHTAIPSHFRDPLGLAARLLRANSDARFAMLLAGLGILTSPLDMTLAPIERRLYRRSSPPRLPIIFVCGPPRSGTTVVASVIARALPVAYFTNFTAMFPRAPITASRLFHQAPTPSRLSHTSHYGRTRGLLGWNDGLHLWDRWLGRDRTQVHTRLPAPDGEAMARFMGAYERWTGRPLVNKNNSLNAHAHLVAGRLPTARFLCLDRDPLYLAQSLLVARQHIHNDEAVPYGLSDQFSVPTADPVVDVCRQVRFHRELAHRQRAELGPHRFRILSYEDFCRDPARVVRDIAHDILELEVDETRIPATLQAARNQKLPDGVFRRLERELVDGGLI